VSGFDVESARFSLMTIVLVDEGIASREVTCLIALNFFLFLGINELGMAFTTR
jgi:hypothetical protein